MRPKELFLTFHHICIFAGILVLLTACSSPPSEVSQKDSPSGVQAAQEELVDAQIAPVEGVEDKVDAADLTPLMVQTEEVKVTSLLDGTSLLNRHCTRCHLVQALEQTGKSRLELEQKLAQMEAFGVLLDDIEKEVLLDYLAGD